MKLKFSLLALLLVLFGTRVSAASPNNILVDMSPSNPEPYGNVTITLNSYVNNLDSVLITWKVDGKTLSSGTGKKSFSLTAPQSGGEADVVATISLPDGVVDTTIVVRPSVMVLLWQADDSYVPPFYRGKALPSTGSSIRVVSMPEIKTSTGFVNTQNMTYVWQKDYDNQVDASGYGKNSFSFINDYLENSNTVSVVASTLDGKYSARGDISVGPREPKILFYKNDNELGTIFEQSLPDDYTIQGPETIEAVPYFISPKQINIPTLVWSWFINDNRVTLSGSRNNLMPVQAAAGTHGSSKLSLELESRNKIFQPTIKKSINIQY